VDFKAGYRETKRQMALPMLLRDKIFLFTHCGLGLLIAAILTSFWGYDPGKTRSEAELINALSLCLALPIMSLYAVIHYFGPRWSILFRTQKGLARCASLLLGAVKCSVLVLAGGTVFYILSTGAVPFLLVVYYHLFMAEILTKAATDIKDIAPFKDYGKGRVLLEFIVQMTDGGKGRKD
jgi:hypothetical protein